MPLAYLSENFLKNRTNCFFVCRNGAEGRTAYHWAMKTPNLRCLKLLCKHARNGIQNLPVSDHWAENDLDTHTHFTTEVLLPLFLCQYPFSFWSGRWGIESPSLGGDVRTAQSYSGSPHVHSINRDQLTWQEREDPAQLCCAQLLSSVHQGQQLILQLDMIWINQSMCILQTQLYTFLVYTNSAF